jgi:hypothetical protein
MGEACSTGRGRGTYTGLAVKPVGKRPLERPLCGRNDDIKMDLKSVRKAWIGLIWLRAGPSGGFF